jgi:hypothetical protein
LQNTDWLACTSEFVLVVVIVIEFLRSYATRFSRRWPVSGIDFPRIVHNASITPSLQPIEAKIG